MQYSILESRSWLQLKVFMNLPDETNWKERLNCYFGILSFLRPILTNKQLIDTFFFSQYGPEDYALEPETIYEKKLQVLPTNKISYIRIRIHPMEEKRIVVIDSVTRSLTDQALVLGFEILNKYDARGDLGYRYGKRDDDTIDDEATINFIKYWDSGCRYILSVLNDSREFRRNVDVWGIPHLLNNAIGSFLRLPSYCPRCGGRLWLLTTPIEISEVSIKKAPVFPIYCQDCELMMVCPSNI